MSLCASGPPVGALVLEAGTVIAEGRNHAYDPPGGDDRLQGSPIAHAEMNALAAVATGTDLAGMTVWSSHRPCSMCTRGVRIHRGRRRPVHRSRPSDPSDTADPDNAEHRWLIVAKLLFLAGIRAYSGAYASMIARARAAEPETARLLDSVDRGALQAPTLAESLAPIWSHIDTEAQLRQLRLR